MAPKRCDPRLETLVVRLRDNESMSYEKIAAKLNMSKDGVYKIYKRMKNPKAIDLGGRPRKTTVR